MTATATSRTTAQLAMVTVDCEDPRALAAFWSAVLGWDVAHSEEEYAMLTAPQAQDGPALGFGRVDGYTPPSWPDAAGAKQFHLDLTVEDLATAESTCVQRGATVPGFQPGEGRWRVLLDPAGHPFCLTRADAWS